MTSVTSFGRYELVRRLAGGGMGEVFAAQMRGAEGFVKQVALKRIYPHLAGNPKHRQLFVREAKLVAQLAHPNIVQVLELGTEGDELFMAMEFVHGVTLSQALRAAVQEGRRLSVEAAIAVAFDVLEALAYAHDYNDQAAGIRGIVHADVSPQNIMLTVQGRAKICDFGVAKLLRSTNREATERGRWGKVAYMAPEQITSDVVDARSDVYAIAVIMVEMITGHAAYSAKSIADLSEAILRGERQPLHFAAPHVPIEIAAAIERGCALDPKVRFQTAEAMRRALVEPIGTQSLDDARRELMGLVRAQMESEPKGDGPGTSVISASETSVPLATEKSPPRGRRLRAFLGAGLGAAVAAALLALAWPKAVEIPAAVRQEVARFDPQPRFELEEPDVPRAEAVVDTPSAAVVEDPATRPSRAKRTAKPANRAVHAGPPALLTLNSVPWAYVTLDGQKLAKTTPLFDYELEAGTHTIQLRAANGRTRKLMLDLRPGEVVRQVVNLE